MSNKQESVADDSKLTFMFEFPIKNVCSIPRGEWRVSHPFIVNGVSWEIWIMRNNKDRPNDTFDLFIHCTAKPKLWSCFASVEFTLVSQKSGVNDVKRELKHLFSSSTSTIGYSNFVDWNVVSNYEKGFLTNDILRIRAHIVADIPNNTTWDYGKKEPETYIDWLIILEDTLNEKMVRRISDEFKKLNATMIEGQKSFENLKTDFNKIAAEQIYTKNFKTVLKEAIDPVVEIVQAEIRSFEKKFEKIQDDYAFISARRGAQISLLEDKIDKSSASCLTAVEELKSLKLEDTESPGNNGKNERGDGTENKGIKVENILDKSDFSDGEPILLSMMKMLNDLKNDVAKQLFYNRQQRFANGFTNLYGSNCSSGCNSHHSRHRFAAESNNSLMEKYLSSYSHCGSCSHSNARRDQGNLFGSSHPLHNAAELNDDLSESYSIDAASSLSAIKSSKLTNFGFPSEEEALSRNLDITEPLRVKSVFVGICDDGEMKTHAVSCLKEFYDLKKIYRRFEIIKPNQN